MVSYAFTVPSIPQETRTPFLANTRPVTSPTWSSKLVNVIPFSHSLIFPSTPPVASRAPDYAALRISELCPYYLMTYVSDFHSHTSTYPNVLLAIAIQSGLADTLLMSKSVIEIVYTLSSVLSPTL
jgi:hypothetical protein